MFDNTSSHSNQMPLIGAHIARYTSPPTQYLGSGRGYSGYNPLIF